MPPTITPHRNRHLLELYDHQAILVRRLFPVAVLDAYSWPHNISYDGILALLTTAHAPPEIAHGIAEARANIARVKAILHASGVQVADHPDDNEGSL